MKINYSKIIAGVMNWGGWGKQLSRKEMVTLTTHCIEEGITTFDHADIYGGYTTEIDFGHAFAQSGINRDMIQLISKCGIQYPSENRNNKINYYDYRKDYIIKSVDQSLKNLQTEYLDSLLLHRPSPLMHPDEIAQAISILKQQGKIRDFGVSNFTPSQVNLISENIEVSANQIEFSLTKFDAMHDGTLDQMFKNKIIPMAWSPLGHVFKEDSEQTRRIHKQLGKLIDIYQATEDQLLLAWILKHPANIRPVIGTTNPERISKAMTATQINLDLEDWFLLLVSSQGHRVP